MDNLLEVLKNISMDEKIDAFNVMAQFLPKVELKDYVEGSGAARTELKVKDYFSLGVYARHLYIPKDTIVVGKIHKYQNLNILAQGDISVLVNNEIQRIVAPFTVVAPPGTRRIGYSHEDCVWITIHRTDLVNVDEIENEFIAQSRQDYLEFQKQLSLPLEAA